MRSEIVLDDIDYGFRHTELVEIRGYWNQGYNVASIADLMKRKQLEIHMALIDLALKNKIKDIEILVRRKESKGLLLVPGKDSRS